MLKTLVIFHKKLTVTKTTITHHLRGMYTSTMSPFSFCMVKFGVVV